MKRKRHRASSVEVLETLISQRRHSVKDKKEVTRDENSTYST